MFCAKNFLVVICCLVCLQTARGGDWTAQKSGTLAWLHDVYFVNENKGFVAGSGGAFLSTSDGGKTWTAAREKFTDDTIERIRFTDENNGWLLCQRDAYNRGAKSPSYLLRTRDGGEHWEREEFNFSGGRRERIAGIFFAKNGLAMANGESGALLVYDDEAKTWKRVASSTRYLLRDGVFTDDFHAIIVGAGGSVLFSDDAGASWNKAAIYGEQKPKLAKVFFVNPKLGWTVGGAGKIYQTINGGKSWREQTSTVARDLTDVFFSNTAEGWAVGDGGAILHSTTSGNIWTPVASNTTHKLERVFFNGKKGFAVGFGGTILSFDNAPTSKNAQSKPQLQKRSN